MVDIESPPCAAHDLVLMQYNQKFFEPAASTTYTGMAFMYSLDWSRDFSA